MYPTSTNTAVTSSLASAVFKSSIFHCAISRSCTVRVQAEFISLSAFKNKLLLKVSWKNRTHNLKKPVLMNDSENGGLNLEILDFRILNNTFKIIWLQSFL